MHRLIKRMDRLNYNSFHVFPYFSSMIRRPWEHSRKACWSLEGGTPIPETCNEMHLKILSIRYIAFEGILILMTL